MHSSDKDTPAEAPNGAPCYEEPTASAATASLRPAQRPEGSLRGNRANRLRMSRDAVTHAPQPPVSVPTPLPKRPKGRLFVGFLLLALCGLICHTIWDWQFRYEAHGVVRGRVLHVSPPWNGNVAALHVREGDTVRQGQLLFGFDNIQHQQRLAEVADQLKLAQAKLEAQVSQLKWQSQLRGDRNQKALGEYYQAWGELLEQRSQLSQADADLQRLVMTQKKNSLAVRQKDLDHARFRLAGQQAKVEKLDDAVQELKKRVEIYEQFQDDATAQIRPELLNIENLQAELKRLRQLVQQGQVRSPANGTVVKIHRFAGDYAEASQPIMEIVEDSSLEPVLYVPQDRADKLRVGDEIEVQIAPSSRQITCRVVRLGDQMEVAPSNIARYYRKDEKLLPVFLQPRNEDGEPSRIYLGSEVKLSHRWFRRVSTTPQHQPPVTEDGEPSEATHFILTGDVDPATVDTATSPSL